MSAYAEIIPQLINYSGTLTSKADGTKPTGTYNMTFSLYSSATGSAPLWQERWATDATPASPVPVTNGTFNVLLGSIKPAVNPLPDDFFARHPKLYLGTKVGNDSEMLPRQRITSVGYAFAAGNGIPKGGIIMWSGSTVDIPTGWALCDGNNGTPNLMDRFIVGAGTNYNVGAGTKAVTDYFVNLYHSHTVNSHNHNFTAEGNHQHWLGLGWDSADRAFFVGDDPIYGSRVLVGSKHQNGIDGTSSANYREAASDTSGHHGHGFTAQAPLTDSKLSANQDIRPPYYALAFIMKL
jgi:hypothetical protein